MSTDSRQSFGDFMWLQSLDKLTFSELCREFDAACERARGKGMWLYESDPEFCEYCRYRLPYLAELGAGLRRE